jgi:hypothetical protein
VGQTPSIAARLQMLAAPGTVLISGATHALVRGFFVCEPLGPQALRGVSQLTEVFPVQRVTGVTTRFELAVAAGLKPPVNRQHELATLVEAFERARGGAGQIVWIVGDAGIGKSRLLQMFQERAHPTDPVLAARPLRDLRAAQRPAPDHRTVRPDSSPSRPMTLPPSASASWKSR